MVQDHVWQGNGFMFQAAKYLIYLRIVVELH